VLWWKQPQDGGLVEAVRKAQRRGLRRMFLDTVRWGRGDGDSLPDILGDPITAREDEPDDDLHGTVVASSHGGASGQAIGLAGPWPDLKGGTEAVPDKDIVRPEPSGPSIPVREGVYPHPFAMSPRSHLDNPLCLFLGR